MDHVLYEGKFLKLGHDEGKSWEYVSRANATGVVAILAVTENREILVVEQFRPPLGKKVIELPAGLAGDEPLKEEEPLVSAAKRELYEETGYEAKKWWSLLVGPTSSGMTDETITFFLATELTRISERDRFGVGGEDIKLHHVPIGEVLDFMRRQTEEGKGVDFKIYAALYVARQHPMYPV
ncbi:MAG: NUDIX hydrolase [Verrucomicrobiota bacterium]